MRRAAATLIAPILVVLFVLACGSNSGAGSATTGGDPLARGIALHNQGKLNGRDHNNQGFSYILAGGGVKGGLVYGATDDFGFKAVDKPVHVHDLHATILHLLGIDHTKLTYRYSGRDFRLTDVSGTVIHDIIA